MTQFSHNAHVHIPAFIDNMLKAFAQKKQTDVKIGKLAPHFFDQQAEQGKIENAIDPETLNFSPPLRMKPITNELRNSLIQFCLITAGVLGVLTVGLLANHNRISSRIHSNILNGTEVADWVGSVSDLNAVSLVDYSQSSSSKIGNIFKTSVNTYKKAILNQLEQECETVEQNNSDEIFSVRKEIHSEGENLALYDKSCRDWEEAATRENKEADKYQKMVDQTRENLDYAEEIKKKLSEKINYISDSYFLKKESLDKFEEEFENIFHPPKNGIKSPQLNELNFNAGGDKEKDECPTIIPVLTSIPVLSSTQICRKNSEQQPSVENLDKLILEERNKIYFLKNMQHIEIIKIFNLLTHTHHKLFKLRGLVQLHTDKYEEAEKRCKNLKNDYYKIDGELAGCYKVIRDRFNDFKEMKARRMREITNIFYNTLVFLTSAI